MLDSLLAELVAQGVFRSPAPVTSLSGGRTNRVWQIRDGVAEYVLKLYDPGCATPLFANDAQAEALVLDHLRATDLAPRKIASGEAACGDWLLYQYVPGEKWDRNAFAVGAQLAAVHKLGLPRGLKRGPNGSDALISQTKSMVSMLDAPVTDNLTRDVPAAGDVAPIAPVLTHGDLVPANILLAADRVTFIDWQCPALSDPCEDIATFLSPAMQIVYRGASLAPEDERAFIDGYANPSVIARYRKLEPLYHWRMAIYCQWRVQTGDLDYAQGLEAERMALTKRRD